MLAACSGQPDRDHRDLYDDAARVVVRTAFARMARERGLPVPDGVLPTGLTVPREVLAQVEADLAFLDGAEVEELGYAYESLLGFTCVRGERGWVVVPDASRKHAGAHYTPRALADEVVAHALEPLLADGRAVLDLRVADITVGTGVFLVAAARQLAGAAPLAAVIRTCLHGTDLDPTAVEICRLSLWLLAADPDLPVTFLDDHVRRADALLDATWAGRDPYDAVVGNPPFLGVKNIRSAIGQELRDRYARTLLGGESGRSDLVVFFLARAALLSRGVVGLVLPDAVAEGDSARFGLGALLARGARIYRAETSRAWPSDAGVRIALVWLQTEGTAGEAVLDGVPVPSIGAALGRSSTGLAPRKRPAPSWMPHGHQATIVLGRSLLLTHDEAADLAAADPRAARWIRDYTSGDDLVTSPDLASSRRVLDLGATELDELLAVPVIAARLDAVRAERAGQLARYPQLAKRWWGFLAPVDRLYDALAGEPEAIALSKHAKYVWPVLVPTGPVFSNGAIVFPSADRAVYGFLASEPHRLWAISEGGSRLNQSHRYNPSRLLTTYPFPASIEGVRGPGEQLADAVEVARADLGLGITALLNLVHGATPAPRSIELLRAAVVEVDRAVLAAHGIVVDGGHALRDDGTRTWFGLDAVATAAVKAALVEAAGA